jgi:penicillin-binding protein 1A
MNYGRKATEKKIRSVQSNLNKYTSRIFLTVFKTCLIFAIFLGCVGFSIGIGMLKGIIDSAPEINVDSIVPIGYATTVYDSAGNLTDTLVTAGSNREEATYEELPEDLINAFVAIEDSRFWTHNGIDIRSITRAAVGVLSGENRGGGSTITQQLIKNNVFNGGMETSFGAKLERKFQEQYLALQLTKSMDKKLILTNYLNTINLGNNTLGVKVAARRYFNKEVSDLTLSEATVIAGITQNPSSLNPITGREKNEEKRKVILQYMYEQGYITKEEQEEALADDVYSRIQSVDLVSKESSTPYSYFTDELTSQVKETLMEKLGYTDTQAHNLLYSGGLQIYTTQDPEIQAIVDEEVNDPANYSAARYSLEYRLSVTHADGTTTHYSEKQIESWHKSNGDDFDGLYNSEEEVDTDIEAYKAYQLTQGDEIIGETIHKTLQPQVSFVIMDQATGQVKAISGGRGEKTASLTLNRATNSVRQPGSTFKVITSFAPAIDTCGATLGSVYYDAPYTIGTKTFNNWYSQGYLGYSSIRDGIIYSMNIVAVRCLMETVTPQLGVEYAKNFGITTLTDEDMVPALALGGITNGVTNLELTGAYAAIANGGVYTKPVFFTKILDHDGKILIDNEPTTHRVLKDSTAFLLTDAMKDSMISNRKWTGSGYSVSSTSTRAKLENMSCAGKSGTTSNNNDIWFVGFTPYYTAGVWGGCDNNQKLTSQNGGTSFHKDIWKKIMTRVHEELPDPGFTVPDSVTTAEICRKSGKLSVSGICSQDGRGNASYTEYFALDNIPAEVCDKHVRVTVCSVSGLLPSESCPKETAIRIAIPEDAEGSTDDSSYAMPSGYCSGHASVIVDTDDDEVSYSGPGSSGTNSGKKAKATFHAPGYSGSTNNTSKTDSNNSSSPSGSTAPTAPADGGSTGRVSKGPGRD